jgi:hypothetical protein
MPPDLLQRDPPLRANLQTPLYQIQQLGTHRYTLLEGRPPTGLGVEVGGERRFAGDEDHEEDAEGPDFGMGGDVGGAAEDLGGGVGGRAAADRRGRGKRQWMRRRGGEGERTKRSDKD